jgi:hypothetical protein
MLNLFRHHPSKDRDQFVALHRLALDHLQSIRSNPPPEPPPDSPAALAFDVNITRKLNNFMPLKAHCLPPQDFAWDALADLLGGWADIYKVSAVASLTTWKVRSMTLSSTTSALIFVDCGGSFRKFRTSFSEAPISPCFRTGQFRT